MPKWPNDIATETRVPQRRVRHQPRGADVAVETHKLADKRGAAEGAEEILAVEAALVAEALVAEALAAVALAVEGDLLVVAPVAVEVAVIPVVVVEVDEAVEVLTPAKCSLDSTEMATVRSILMRWTIGREGLPRACWAAWESKPKAR
jgi:hypothetical protein